MTEQDIEEIVEVVTEEAAEVEPAAVAAEEFEEAEAEPATVATQEPDEPEAEAEPVAKAAEEITLQWAH